MSNTEVMEVVELEANKDAENEHTDMSLNEFLNEFNEQLIEQVEEQIPPCFKSITNMDWDNTLNSLLRQPISKQREKIHAVCTGLIDKKLEAVVLNGEMGTGKTYMSIATSAIYWPTNKKPILVMSPPHLVYKWRREILDTVPDANVTVINGGDAINRLMKIRESVFNGTFDNNKPHYVVIGRVRMRMGFYWKLAYNIRKEGHLLPLHDGGKSLEVKKFVTCSSCGKDFKVENESIEEKDFVTKFVDKRVRCSCGSPMWTMMHKKQKETDKASILAKFLTRLPGIGKVRANKLIARFGEDILTSIIDDNIYDFVHLMDEEGEYIFDEKHSKRIERSLGRLEFALRFISYQPSEYIKRYFPRKFFGLTIVDEAHEYKNGDSAQGQAMGVLASCSDNVLALTGTLMGGYASDLFYLLFRSMPRAMTQQGFNPTQTGSFASAESSFMKQYGILIEQYKTTESTNHRTSRGKNVKVNVKKAPGFSPVGIAKFIFPYTVFMRMTDIGEDALPNYTETTHLIPQDDDVMHYYQNAEKRLVEEMKIALRNGDNSMTGLVMNWLLRWPDTCANAETVRRPRKRDEIILNIPSFGDDIRPKEQLMIDLCLESAKRGRRSIVYTTYTGGHDTSTRLKELLNDAGLKAKVLRSSVKADSREDWIANEVENGLQVLICNPELVKTGLDLLAFPTINFMQTGFNTYTTEQASRRSYRIGQKDDVEINFLGYEKTQQASCYKLMAQKIMVNQSTSGVMPDSGLDIFDNEDGVSSLMTEMAKELLKPKQKDLFSY